MGNNQSLYPFGYLDSMKLVMMLETNLFDDDAAQTMSYEDQRPVFLCWR